MNVQSRMTQSIVITGISGSGKSTALRSFEDMGYFCVDNLPIALLPQFLALLEQGARKPVRVALVMDLREESFVREYRSIFQQIQADGFHMELLFLNAKDDILVRRYSQTRRHHPLQQSGDILSAIHMEREQLASLRESADRVLDTSELNVHQLRQAIFQLYSQRADLNRFVIQVVSFGFKYGVPADANLVFDVRFLANPYFEPELKPLDGRTEAVQRFLAVRSETRNFLRICEEMLSFLVPQYRSEGKSYLVIAFGCTGGFHRSVAIAEYLGNFLRSPDQEVIVSHRDIGRGE
ncbi:MAG: RNase adapter RapZ [Dissulfuribacterales bacterium]